MREGAAGAGKRGMAAHGAVTSGCGGAVKGVAAACARASVQPLRVRPLIAAHGAEGAGAAAATAEASDLAHEATARARSSRFSGCMQRK